MFKRIQIPTDFSEPSEHAAKYAGRICEDFSAEARVIHTISALPFCMYGTMTKWQQAHVPDEVIDKAKEDLDAFLRKLGLESPISGENIISSDNVAGSICNDAKNHGADLIVMSTHGRSGFKRFLLGSIAEQVIRQAPCPILTLTAEASESPSWPLKNVIVATDFSDYGTRCLHFVQELRKHQDCNVTALHVVDEELLTRLHVHPMLQEDFDKNRIVEGTKKLLEEKVKDLGIESEIQREVLSYQGNTGDGITDFAQNHNADLVIVGSRGWGEAKSMLLGSVASRVVRQASCPVIVLR